MEITRFIGIANLDFMIAVPDSEVRRTRYSPDTNAEIEGRSAEKGAPRGQRPTGQVKGGNALTLVSINHPKPLRICKIRP
jgi:hypothetical protein